MTKLKHFSLLLVAGLLICLLMVPHTLMASSADLTFTTENSETNPNIELIIGGLIPTDVASYEMKVNINQDAFTYISAEGLHTEGINYDFAVEDGILTITANNAGGVIGAGETDLVKVYLEAKAPGSSTVLLLNSNFVSSYGQPVPGTLLRYYTINVIGKQTDEPTPAPVITTTTLQTSTSTEVPETSKNIETSDEGNETSTDLETEEVSSSGTSTSLGESSQKTESSSSSASATSENSESSTDIKTKTSAESSSQTPSSTENPIKRETSLNWPIILIIVLFLLAIIGIMIRLNNKRK